MSSVEGHPSGFANTVTTSDGSRREFKYQKDEVLVRQGDPADEILYIKSGCAKIAVVSPFGKEAVVGIVRSDNFCGEECLSQTLYATTVTALSECAVTRLEKGALLQTLGKDHGLARSFMVYLAARQVRIQDDLAAQLLYSTERRLARQLLILAESNALAESKQGVDVQPIAPQFSQETLAAMIGASRTHVNFFMNKFRESGFINYKNGIEVNRSLLSFWLQEEP